MLKLEKPSDISKASLDKSGTKLKITDQDLFFREADLDEINSIMSLIYGQSNYDSKNDIEFETRLGNVTAELKTVLPGQHNVQAVKKGLQLKAKYAMLDLCYTKALEVEDNEKNKSIWNLIKIGHDQAFEELLSIVIGLKPEHNFEIGKMKTQIETTKKEMREILEASERLREEIKRLTQEKAELLKKAGEEKAELIEKVKELSSDNRKCFDTIQKYQKASASPAKISEDLKKVS